MLTNIRFDAATPRITRCRTKADVKKATDYLKKQPVIALDTETTGLRWWEEGMRPFYLSATDGKRAFGIPLAPCMNPINGLFTNPAQVHWYWNAKFDVHALLNLGHEDNAIICDAMFLAALLDENSPKSLKHWSSMCLPEGEGKQDSVEEWFRANKVAKDARRYDMVPREILEPYAIQDTIATWNLAMGMQRYLQEVDTVAPAVQVPEDPWNGLKRILGIEEECLLVLIAMERHGYAVNRGHFERMEPLLALDASQAENRARKYLRTHKIKGDFNLASTKDLSRLFLEHLHIDPSTLPLTDKGAPSFSEEGLEAMDHPVADAILEYRKALTLKDTFGRGMLSCVAPDGAIHPSYMQVHPRTGRMSCQDPNLQNLPRVNHDNPRDRANMIRKGFVPRKGCELLFFDYSQIEMRIFAHYCQDPTLLSAIREGRDLHAETAAVIHEKPVSKVTKMERQDAKTTNFATIYGAGAKGLSKQLKVPYVKAMDFKNKYMRRFPKIKAFFDQCQKDVELRGYVETHWGRRRHLNPERAHVAVNAVVQGSAADLIKIAAPRVHSILRGTGAHIVNLVHDDIQIEAPEGLGRELVPKIVEAMEDFQFSVPIKVDVAVSRKSWGEQEKWKA